ETAGLPTPTSPLGHRSRRRRGGRPPPPHLARARGLSRQADRLFHRQFLFRDRDLHRPKRHPLPDLQREKGMGLREDRALERQQPSGGLHPETHGREGLGEILPLSQEALEENGP